MFTLLEISRIDLGYRERHFERHRAIAVKVAAKRLPVFLFSGFDVYHYFRNDAFYDLYHPLKSGK